jgi:hypothetical protein
MKTKILIARLATGLLMIGQPALAAGSHAIATSHAASFGHRLRADKARRPAPVSERDISGVISRAIRGGNLVQMLNPRAPAKYGTAEESVSLDPEVPGKGDGIKLFSISF